MLNTLVAVMALTVSPTDTAASTSDSPPQVAMWSCEILMPEDVARDNYAASTWPGGVVPYEFDENVDATNRARTRSAMDEIEAVCAVRFVPRTSEIDRIVVTDADSNNSFVGPIGGPQTVRIRSWNVRFIIVHELIHALGSWHEQQRPDRDQYVQINLENVESGQQGNFSIRSDTFPLGEYDFDSVMHYGQFTFSGNGQRTITVLPPNEAWQAQIGQYTHLSEGDIAVLTATYGAVNAADLSGDGTVDATDLAIILAAWDGPDVDFDGDGICAASDLAILLAAWSK